MFKKIFAVVLGIMMIFTMMSCTEDTETVATTQSTDSGKIVAQDNINEIEISEKLSISELANKMGLVNEECVMFEMINAINGFQYNDGTIELYEYDLASDFYKNIIDTNTIIFALTEDIDITIDVASAKNGYVLILTEEITNKEEYIKLFNEILN